MSIYNNQFWSIEAVDKTALPFIQAEIDNKTKPPGSLGRTAGQTIGALSVAR